MAHNWQTNNVTQYQNFVNLTHLEGFSPPGSKTASFLTRSSNLTTNERSFLIAWRRAGVGGAGAGALNRAILVFLIWKMLLNRYQTNVLEFREFSSVCKNQTGNTSSLYGIFEYNIIYKYNRWFTFKWISKPPTIRISNFKNLKIIN